MVSLLLGTLTAAGEDKKPADSQAVISADLQAEDSFYAYLQQHNDKPSAAEEILLTAADAAVSEQNSSRPEAFLDTADVIKLDEQGYAEWAFEVPQDAVYRLRFTYCPTVANLRNPQMSLLLDGKLPYISAGNIELSKLWEDSAEEEYDVRGNQLQSEAAQRQVWQTEELFDDDGLLSEAHRLFLTAGRHTIRIRCERDGLAFTQLILHGAEELLSYEQLRQEYEKQQYPVIGELQVVQAEKINRKSDVQISAVSDFSDPMLVPYDVAKIRYNTMGGSTWSSSGQWVEYDVSVKESGLYALGFKFKQSIQQGMAVCRNIYVDGRIPAKEFESVQFPYTLKWTNQTVKDANGQPCYVYLEAGRTHTIRLECTPGIWRELLQTVNAIYSDLTALYRKIIMVTSANPDELRDYKLESQITGLTDLCTAYSGALLDAADRFDVLNGKKASQSEILRRMADQLDSFAERPDTIPKRLKDYRDNVSGISSWLQSMGNQPLLLDSIMLGGEEEDSPRPTANLWEKIKNFVLGFISSFAVDYNSIGGDDKDAIEVWVNGGRDYANIVKRMIDTYYTPQTGKAVNLSMVQGVIIEATLAGSGPEVCIEVARGYPVNLASRGALVDISGMEGFDEVRARYTSDAMVPYTYHNGVYGVPLSQTFFMMFYRTDIFKDLGLEVPQTWTQFMDVAKLLQRKNMDVCLPYSTVTNQDSAAGGIGAKDIFSSLLMQMGGSFYNDELTETGLESAQAVEAFQMWTDFYAKYSYPLTMDFNSRFRSGDVPLGILSYQAYCTLTAAAPEIRGLWEMTLIPGIQQEDGTIDRTVGASGSCVSIFRKAQERGHVEDCWDFVKWFTQDDMQYQYASRIEAAQGEAGRYPTANLNTFQMLSWSNKEAAVLNAQRAWLREVEEVPGSYYVSRCLDNGFRAVVYRSENVRDTLRRQNKLINEELQRKAAELKRKR